MIFYPKDVVRLYELHYPNEAITDAMSRCIKAPDYNQLEDIRNVLTHRGVPPRKFSVGGDDDGKAHMPGNPKDPSAQWNFNFEIHDQTTEKPRQWLASAIVHLLISAKEFCKSKL